MFLLAFSAISPLCLHASAHSKHEDKVRLQVLTHIVELAHTNVMHAHRKHNNKGWL